jgi:SAUR family protein
MLLEKAAEEFGFDQSGGLTIPCEIETFKYLIKCIETQEKEQHDDASCK